MSFKFCSLASGSSGNCQYIETSKVKVLVDAGLSGKKIQGLLSSIDVEPNTIDFMLITHEHGDHIKGAGILSRRFNIPIYANENTWNSMKSDIGEIKEENIKIFKTEKEFEMADLGILPFNVSHDSNEPVGYSFYNKGKKLSIITDTGHINDSMKKYIKQSDLIFMESNHDTEMLKLGSYPWNLKQRISSDIGHLSNDDAGNVLSEILNCKNEKVLLAHLSRENNFPELAYQTVINILNEKGINTNKDVSIDMTFREQATKIYEL